MHALSPCHVELKHCEVVPYICDIDCWSKMALDSASGSALALPKPGYCPRSWAITYTFNTVQPALLQHLVILLMFCILSATSPI